jgi:hypothetical protein
LTADAAHWMSPWDLRLCEFGLRHSAHEVSRRLLT